MAEKISVQCYRCKTVYELEYELRGELVECTVCNTIFVVPKLGEDHDIKILKTNPYVEESSNENQDSNLHTSPKFKSGELTTKTKTIKLSRTSCGMIPDVDDKFGARESHDSTHYKKSHNAEENVLEDVVKPETKTARETPSKWWPFGSRKK